VAKRTKKSQFPKKRGDTRIGTIEKKYNVDFGVRSDKNLENYLKDEGLPSLGKALERARKRG